MSRLVQELATLVRRETGNELPEGRLPFLREGEGAHVLVVSHALVTGFQPMAVPPATVAKVLEREDMAVFRVDFAKELTASLWALLLGFAEQAAARRA